MGFKEIWNQTKRKLYEAIEKGNSELKKYSAGIQMVLYSKPMLGGFVTKQVFEGERELFVPIDAFKDKDIIIHTIFKLQNKDDIYVVTKIDEEEYIEELTTEGKTYTYPCHIVKYRTLNDVFTEETMGMVYREFSQPQHDTLNLIRKEIEKKPFAVQVKKEACMKLWQYFTECISYQLKDHYVMETFVKIADDYVEDFSALLLKLFA
ncbi:MAG: hypothetical protein K2J85_00685 [Anaeroplasmataceae bacterium]|nr:hypothetical protein [Anaeroplasmataceae bacterium]